MSDPLDPGPSDFEVRRIREGMQSEYIAELEGRIATLEKTLYYERDRDRQAREDLLERQAQVKRLEERVKELEQERAGRPKTSDIAEWCEDCQKWHERGMLTMCKMQRAFNHLARKG